MSKKKVLIIQRILPPYRVALFQALCESDVIDVMVAYGRAHKSSALRSESQPKNVQTYSLQNYSWANEKVVVQSGVFKVIKEWQPDVVIAEFNIRILSTMLLWVYMKATGRAFIWWGHGMGKKGNSLIRKIRLWLIKRTSGLILYGKRQAAEMVNMGVQEDKVFIAPNTIDTKSIDKLSHAWVANKRFRIIHIGRVIKNKKIDILLDAYQRVIRKLPGNVCLTIIGEGPELASLAAKVELLGLSDRVEFTGAIFDESELAEYFNTALISVSSGRVGLNVIHSLAYGIPMLVSKDEAHGPEIQALTHGENAILFRTDDVDILAEEMATMINDREKLADMSQAARRVVDAEYNLNNMRLAFETAVKQAVV